MNRIERKRAYKLFLLFILLGLIIFSAFFLVQNKKDQKFENSRQGILELIQKLNLNSK